MSDDSAPPPEQLSRDDLEERVRQLEAAGSVIAMFVNALRDDDEERIGYHDEEFVPAALEAFDELGDAIDRLPQIENQLEAIQDLGREKTTKEEKVAAIVQFAQNRAGEDATSGRIALKPSTIKGVAGVTERYAYQLVDDLSDEYEFMLDRSDISQYGDLEIDKDTQHRALIVDLGVLHSDEQALNKFINETTREEASA